MGRHEDKNRAVSELRHPLTTSLPSRADLQELLSAIAHGDVDALRTLYDGTAPLVFGILHATMGSAARAEQATERVYLGLWRTAPRLDPDNSSVLWELLFAVRCEVEADDLRPT